MSGSPSYEAGSSFRPAFLFLRPERRRALSAFYGFARSADDIADDPALAPGRKEELLRIWRDRVEALFGGGAPVTPLEAELAFAIKSFRMRKENFLLVLDGVETDVRGREYAGFEELQGYMRRVAGAVGLACLEIFGCRGERAEALAENLGCAVQLTNIIRDVSEDAAAGRVYLPLEDLARFGCARESLKSPARPDNFIELLKFEAARARGFYAAARALAAGPDREKLLNAFIMAWLYEGLLDKLEAGGFRSASGRVRPGWFEKLGAVWKAWRFTRRP
ncbi:MAG: hypothetical protein A3J79_02150 [Elusimicrobia bacterium RIFOXYB2_FULL_62_6]|nr:MAG: hypothetical protein A3J79_02150 [Elusimicrobia bacterium RIFOXYB2_FULL_62_6]